MEVGSIYEINPASVKGCSSESRKKFALRGLDGIKKYKKRYCVYTASGREAIALALRSLARNRPELPKRCLLPAYMCDTVFLPFEREGWEIHFYHVNKRLEVNESELRTQIEQLRPGLLFIHPYYGVDTWKHLRSMLIELKRQGSCIMEDVTQSYYLEGVGKEADYVVGSLRKWYPVPDGGFVVSDEKLLEGSVGKRTGKKVREDVRESIEKKIGEDIEDSTGENIEEAAEYARARLKLLMDKWEYLYGECDEEKKKLIKEAYLKKNRELEEELDRYSDVRIISNETAYILNQINEDAAKRQRNDNYGYLSDRLQGKTRFVPIMPVFGEKDGDMCQDETAPLYFAIYAEKRDELQAFLSGRGIYAPVLWPIGKENEDFLTEDERYIYEHMLALPMDQRYGVAGMQRIVEALEEYEGQEGDIRRELIGIRADANETVAMGHIMRCITIARELIKMGNRVVFFTADEYAAEILEQAGMAHVCLHSDWKHMENEVPILRKELEKRGCKKLLVDSYYASAEYFEELSDLCKLIYIDDCFEGIYPVDMLINYNAFHVRFNYEEAYKNKTELLLGTEYVPLREEFQEWRYMKGAALETSSLDNADLGAEDILLGNAVPHILLSSGGGDVYNALAGILGEAVEDEELDNAIFHTVVGRFNPNVKELERLAEENSNIELHYDVSNMAKLMAKCSAAVSAAGTMLFELSAMQLPSVFFVCADNQQYDSEFFAREERMLFAGDIRSDRKGCIGNICSGLKKLLKDEKLRQRMKKALCEVTDGRGAERIAGKIAKL